MHTMDLNKEWRKLNQTHFSNSKLSKAEIMAAITQDSSSTIHELKKRLRHKIYWIVFFIALFITGMLFSVNYPAILLILGFFAALYVAGFVAMLRQYRNMDDRIHPEQDTLTAMKNHLHWMKTALKYENIFGLIGIPTLIIGGFLIPKLYRGIPLADILTDTEQVLILLGVLIILVPLANLLGNKMNDMAYGAYTRRLEENIRKMEEE